MAGLLVFGLDRSGDGLPAYSFAVAVAVAVAALHAAVDRGARGLSVCSGAFLLVDPDVRYVDNGQIITSAGTAAGIDACLHLVRLEHGAAVANALARRMVAAPQRAGGPAQFVEAPG